MRRLALFASISALFLAVLPLGPVQAAGGADPDVIPGSYIVVLNSGDPGSVSAEHSRRHNASVTHVYRHALRGYAAKMSDRAAARIARDSRVAYVDDDRVVTTAHHICPKAGHEHCRYSVSGTVSSEGTGLSGATVTIEGTGLSAGTDGNGAYMIGDVPGGTYNVTASKDGYVSQTQSVTVSSNITGFNFILEPAVQASDGTLSGTVTKTDGTTPLPGAKVEVVGTGLFDETDTNGDYSIASVAGGTHDVTASLAGYGTQTKTVTVNGSTPLDFALLADGTLSGKVTEADGTTPLAAASVVVAGTTLDATTGTDGTYSIASVPGGTHDVTASLDGYTTQTKSVTIDGDKPLNFALDAVPTSTDVAPWGVKRIGADVNSNAGASVHVYVIDTGIDKDHPDLAANIGNGYAYETCKGGSCLATWDDDHGHGTHVAGTVGAIDNGIDVEGVAPQVILHAVKVLAKNGMGSRSGVIAGVDWVTSETERLGVATVANMSLGGSGSKTGTCTNTGFEGSDSYHHAVCNSKNAGAVYAVAAGNSDVDAEGSAPAAYDDAVITVSATSCKLEGQTCKTGSDDWPYWSNWGNNDAGWTLVDSAPVAIAAPGVDVLSTRLGGGTTSMSGTSMASPHVAGAAALFLKSNPQAAAGSAFTNTRNGLLSGAELTGGWTNTSKNPHAENFLDASKL